MLGYYLNLALRSFRRNKVLTALMVLAIALGIGAAMTTLTVFHVLSGDPIPGKSDRLFNVRVDPEPAANYHAGDEPEAQLTRYDAEALLREGKAQRQTITTGGMGAIEPASSTLKPFRLMLRFATADFFPMFDAPMLQGHGWTRADDAARARVVVITRELSEKLFGTPEAVGRSLQLEKQAYRVVGVLDEWRPSPRFYDLYNGRYGKTEQLFVPLSTAMDVKLSRRGNMNCFSADGSPNSDGTALNASCTWLQYWVELESPAQASDFKAYLDNYSAQQRQAGRFQRPPNTRLRDVMELMRYEKVVPSDVRLQMWLAMSFLVVCLINSVGLLLAKFLRRSGEIGVRRALGASRGEIFMQCLVEAVSVGVVGGLLGLGLALLGLALVRQQPAAYAQLAHLDLAMLGTSVLVTLLASTLAGLLPAWRAMQVAPALQLKSQ
jgi:putative ABC transport system permease protein